MKLHRHTLFDDLEPQSVHCATLTELSDGTLLAACYAFSYETAPDSRIVVSRFGGQGWSASATLIDFPGVAVGNPVLYTDTRGAVHLFFAVLHGDAWTDARLAHMTSSDGARTWTTPRIIHEQQGLMTKTRPLEVARRLLLPVYDERHWCSLVLITEPPFEHWALYGDTTARGKTIQPAIVPLSDGTLLMFSRSTRGAIYASRSFNDGFSWTASQPLELSNPNSGIDLLRLRSGLLVLVYNPTSVGRERLALSWSRDEGDTWSEPFLLEDSVGEFSYPYAIQADDGTVHLLYTAQRTAVVHVQVTESSLVSHLEAQEGARS